MTRRKKAAGQTSKLRSEALNQRTQSDGIAAGYLRSEVTVSQLTDEELAAAREAGELRRAASRRDWLASPKPRFGSQVPPGGAASDLAAWGGG